MELLKKIIKNIFKIISLPNIFSVKRNFKKIIFLHPPHCGGNTVHRFLKYNLGLRGQKIIVDKNNDVSDTIEDGKDHLYNFGHFGIDFIKKNFYEKNYFYLLNVRKSKNIYLSNYYRNKRFHGIYEPDSKFPTLEEFLTADINANRDNILCRYLSGLFIYKPNKTKMAEQIYESAVTNLDLFNFIFVLEHSKACLKELPKKLKIPLNYASLFKNKANRHSDSIYPAISKEVNELLGSMTNYDDKLYKIILEKKKIFNI
jgi:hypothetical protein